MNRTKQGVPRYLLSPSFSKTQALLAFGFLVCATAVGAGIAVVGHRSDTSTQVMIAVAIAGAVLAFVVSSTSVWRLALVGLSGSQVFVLALQFLLWIRGLPQLPDQVLSFWELGCGFILLSAAILQAGRRPKMRFFSFDWCVFIYLAIALSLGVILSGNMTLIAYSIRLTYFPVLIYVALRLLPVTSADARRVFVTFLSSAGLLALVGLWMSFVWSPERRSAYLAWTFRRIQSSEFNADFIALREGISVMISLLNNPMYLGPIMALAALICSAAIPFQIERRYRLLWAIGAMFFSVCNMLVFARGSWGIQVLGTFALLLYHPKRKSLIKYILVGALPVIGIYVLFFVTFDGLGSGASFAEFAAKVQQRLSMDSLGFNRSTQWSSVWDTVGSHPFGYGLGQVGHVGWRFSDLANRGAPFIADGWYFKVVAEIGIPGLLAFLAFYVLILLEAVKSAKMANRDDFESTIMVSIPAIIIGITADSIGHNTWDLAITNTFLWVVCALVPVFMRRSRSAT